MTRSSSRATLIRALRSWSATGRARLILAVIAVVAVPLGLWSRSHIAPGAPWVRNALGASLYEIFWIACAQWIWIRTPALYIAAIVLGCTCLVELAQLCDAGWLVALRDMRLGRLLLGQNGGFDLYDFPFYIAGSAAGYGICRIVQGRPS